MRREMNHYKDIDEYISNFPINMQALLQEIRTAIKDSAPQAQEKISYGIPTFAYHGNLVHFAAYDHHIGFYPGADGIATFLDEMKAYKTSKGAVQFPIDQPIPLDLVKKITLFRVKQNITKASK